MWGRKSDKGKKNPELSLFLIFFLLQSERQEWREGRDGGVEGRGQTGPMRKRRPRLHMDGEVAPATRHTGDIGSWTAGDFRLTVTAPPSHSRGCKQVNMESVDTQWSKKRSEITNPATVNEFT